MSATLQWTAPGAAVVVVNSAALASLANNAWANGHATPFDNGTARTLYGWLELVLGSAVTAGTGAPVFEIHRLVAPDGTSASLPAPPGTNSAAVPPGYFVGTVAANASASFTRGNTGPVVLYPGRNVFVVRNALGAALPASGSELRLVTYGEQA